MNFLNLKLKDQARCSDMNPFSKQYFIMFAFILFTLNEVLIEKWTAILVLQNDTTCRTVLLTKIRLFHTHSFLLVNSVSNRK